MKSKKVVLFGTFDLFHPGHLNVLRQARSLGEELVVVVAKDSTCEQIKGQYPVHSEGERLELLRHITLVDDAVLGDEKLGSYDILNVINPDVIAIGYDQDALLESLRDAGVSIPTARLLPYKQGNHKSGVIRKKLNENGI